ncbi:MAG: response regulator transcription factor [Ignavibacteriales bacterium]|nr:response regulator transcription factor [Ignavibacteriales bacterium]
MQTVKILVADDSMEFRTAFTKMLQKQKGIKVVAQAKDGVEAILLAQLLKPDVVMLDISMPVLNGLIVGRKLKLETPGTRIIFVTIHDEQTYEAIADLIGADGYIHKSSIRQDLPKVLNKVKKTLPKHIRPARDTAAALKLMTRDTVLFRNNSSH